MKKNLAVISLSFLLLSCAIETSSTENPALANRYPQGIDDNFIMSNQVSTEFVQGSEDVPLLVEMEKIFDESLGFDSPEGSIMTSSYESKIDLKDVRDFYSKTLPQMGWSQVEATHNKLIFTRENDRLEIDLSIENEQNLVKFFISSDL
jgi:hypothetical protein